MTGRTVNFNESHPNTDPGHVVSAARLKDVRARMEQLAGEQRTGLIAVHTAAVEKQRIRRETMTAPIAHVAEVGGLAAKDHPELVGLFRFKPSKDSLTAFVTAARTMLAAAQEHKETLAPYGLSEAMLELFGQLVEQFEAAVKAGTDGRGQHAGATRELKSLAKEARQIVRAMNARNRYRFKNDQQALGAWIAASTVVAGSVAAEPVEGGAAASSGDVRPAA